MCMSFIKNTFIYSNTRKHACFWHFAVSSYIAFSLTEWIQCLYLYSRYHGSPFQYIFVNLNNFASAGHKNRVTCEALWFTKNGGTSMKGVVLLYNNNLTDPCHWSSNTVLFHGTGILKDTSIIFVTLPRSTSHKGISKPQLSIFCEWTIVAKIKENPLATSCPSEHPLHSHSQDS